MKCNMILGITECFEQLFFVINFCTVVVKKMNLSPTEFLVIETLKSRKRLLDKYSFSSPTSTYPIPFSTNELELRPFLNFRVFVIVS